ncbi:hypothetical protein H4R33_006080 [Dimargaris cristalligena]|nr:hypothetical protein H4R33_006080 [Dimargaris cristalligena]
MKLFVIGTLALAVSSALGGSLPVNPSANPSQCSTQCSLETQSGFKDLNRILCPLGEAKSQLTLKNFIHEKDYSGQPCQVEAECERRRFELETYVANGWAAQSKPFGGDDALADQDSSHLANLHRRAEDGCPVPLANVEEWKL